MTRRAPINKKAKPRKTERVERPGDGRWRICAVAVLFGLVWLALWGRAGYVQLVQGEWLADLARRQHLAAEFERGERGDILDRNGRQLARTVRFNSIYVRPVEVENRDAVARSLAEGLRKSASEMRASLNSGRNFVWAARAVDDRAAHEIAEQKLKGVYLTHEYGRLYPNNHLAGQLLGFTDLDGKGIEGVERSRDGVLAGGKAEFVVQRDAAGRRLYLDAEGREMDIDGRDVTLTIDAHIQDLAEAALARAVEHHNGRAGTCLVVDVPTGEILALANFPFFNPNVYRKQPVDVMRNRAAMDIFEPGSTLKPFLIAAALQEKRVKPESRYFCENGKWKFKNHVINDDIHSYGWLNVTEILRYSSNIGTAKIGLDMGAQAYSGYLARLGFGERTGLNLPGEGRGLLRPPREWRDMDVAAISFGQGIGVTALQLAKAYLCLANDGIAKPLRLFLDEKAPDEPGQRVFDASVARSVREMMIEVVHKDGTGVKARIDGMLVGGKTGTAQKALPGGGYGKNYLSSFVGFFPGDKPRYLILAMVDDPSRAFYGSTVALPVVREVALGALAYTCQLPVKDAGVVGQAKAASAVPAQVQTAAAVSGSHAVIAKAGQAEPVAEADRVPDVRGLPLRKAIEILARQGVVPKLEGRGAVVQRQSPSAGDPWPGQAQPFTLWLKGYAES